MATRSSLAYLKPYRRPLLGGIAMLFLTNLFFLGVPYFQSHAVQAFDDGDE